MTPNSHRHLWSVTIKSLADRLGVSQRTIRLYEEHGLVISGRNERNVRIYAPQQVERLAFVVALRQLDIGLAEISRFLGLPEKDAEKAMRERLVALRDRKSLELAHLNLVLGELGNGVRLSLALRESLRPVD